MSKCLQERINIFIIMAIEIKKKSIIKYIRICELMVQMLSNPAQVSSSLVILSKEFLQRKNFINVSVTTFSQYYIGKELYDIHNIFATLICQEFYSLVTIIVWYCCRFYENFQNHWGVRFECVGSAQKFTSNSYMEAHRGVPCLTLQ